MTGNTSGDAAQMSKSFTAVVGASPDRAAAALADLANYPRWLDVVDRAEPDAGASGDATWIVTLKAKLGPLARSKRLRMTRTRWEQGAAGHDLLFERAELDGRDHAAWAMAINVAPEPKGGSQVTVSLTYGGAMWIGPLDLVLNRAAETATGKLQDYLSDS